MGRPTTKATLLDAIDTELAALDAAVGEVAEHRRSEAGACDGWSVKDILAHLDAWHRMFLGWHQEGRAGARPSMPAEGFTWSETPALNAAIFERHRDDGWDDVTDRFEQSTNAVRAAVLSYEAEELFEKKRYPWTGTTSVGSYAVSATSSHYAWARKLIEAFARSA